MLIRLRLSAISLSVRCAGVSIWPEVYNLKEAVPASRLIPLRSNPATIRRMWLLAWLALAAVAGLCYPRRPRTAGVLFIVLGLFSTMLVLVFNDGNLLAALGAGAFWIGLGTSCS